MPQDPNAPLPRSIGSCCATAPLPQTLSVPVELGRDNRIDIAGVSSRSFRSSPRGSCFCPWSTRWPPPHDVVRRAGEPIQHAWSGCLATPAFAASPDSASPRRDLSTTDAVRDALLRLHGSIFRRIWWPSMGSGRSYHLDEEHAAGRSRQDTVTPNVAGASHPIRLDATPQWRLMLIW